MRGRPDRARARQLGAVVLLGVLGAASAGASPPHVLLVTVDTLRADHTSLHGYRHDTTPTLAALASEGAVFDAAYATAPSTAPTHASILTGLHPARHGVVKNAVPLDAGQHTLAERLAARGYQTAAVVSSFVLAEKFGWSQGFEVYSDDFPEATAGAGGPERWQGHEVAAGFDRRAGPTALRAARWLQGRDRERPFFLFVHFFDPHAPYDPPYPFRNLFPLPPAPPGAGRVRTGHREAVARYDAEIAATDAAIGFLLEVLAAEGLAERTLLLVTADHGEGLLDHGFMRHGTTVYEEMVRVPWLVRGPGVVPGRRFAEPVSLVDLAPTVLELVGAPGEPEQFEGRSLAAALGGELHEPAPRAVYLTRGRFPATTIEGLPVEGQQWGLRRGPWKIVADDSGRPAELYHLGRDAHERRDLRRDNPGRAAALSAELAHWRAGQREPTRLPPLSEEDRSALEALGYTE